MASQIQKVKPGDLISSEFMNNLLDRINELETRIARIETDGGGKVVILEILPEGIVTVGDEMRLIGRNFGTPIQNIVTIAGKRVEQFKSGSDTMLVFDVPAIPGLTDQPQPATLTLSNPTGFDSRMILLRDKTVVRPEGQLVLMLSKSPEGALKAGSTVVFVFDCTVSSNMDETFVFTPTVEAGWPVAVLGVSGPTPSAELLVPKGFPNPSALSLNVQLTIPPNVAEGTKTNLVLTGVSKHNPQGFSGNSGSVPLSVGKPPPPPSQFPVTLVSVRPPAMRDGSAVKMIRGGSAILQFQADLPAGEFTLELEIINETDHGWTIENRMTPQNPIVMAQPGRRLLTTRLSSTEQAGPALLVVRVVSTAHPDQFGEFQLEIKPHVPPEH